MSNRGRPRKANEDLELSGSRNVKVGQIESGDLNLPHIASTCLTIHGAQHWRNIVPPLVAAGTVREADRAILEMICEAKARFHDNTINVKTGLPTVDDKERSRLGKFILDASAKFGMTPLDRARSGVNKKTAGVKTRPQ